MIKMSVSLGSTVDHSLYKTVTGISATRYLHDMTNNCEIDIANLLLSMPAKEFW